MQMPTRDEKISALFVFDGSGHMFANKMIYLQPGKFADRKYKQSSRKVLKLWPAEMVHLPKYRARTHVHIFSQMIYKGLRLSARRRKGKGRVGHMFPYVGPMLPLADPM